MPLASHSMSPVYSITVQSHMRKVYTCLAVICHLHFWQNDRDLWHTTTVTWGWNEYQNKSQHRKLTLEKTVLLPLPLGLKPETFWSWACSSTNELSQLPKKVYKISSGKVRHNDRWTDTEQGWYWPIISGILPVMISIPGKKSTIGQTYWLLICLAGSQTTMQVRVQVVCVLCVFVCVL